MKKVLLTGRPGIGKTTIIRRFIDELNLPSAGFYTQEIRESGNRVGFEIVALDGRRNIMAHVDFNKHYRVGKYGVDLRAIDEIGTKSILHGLERGVLTIIDEIGPMEILSNKFCDAVMKAIRSSNPILGTIAKHQMDFIDAVKSLEIIKLVEVNMTNRDRIPDMILKMFNSAQTNKFKN